MKLLVISSYPEKDLIHGAKTVGVANYTKQTLKAMKEADSSIEIEVWAEVLTNPEEYTEDAIFIKRIWKRKSIFSQIKLMLKTAKKDFDVILFPFEMYMFGGFLSIALFLTNLLYLKICKKKVVLVLHQVLSNDLSAFSTHNWALNLVSSLTGLFYAFLYASSYRIVVFEQALKDRFKKQTKIVVIPHAVLQETKLDKTEARKVLGLEMHRKYVLYFGFLSPYKGVDLLLENWEVTNATQLIIAGGANPNHRNNKEYQIFVSKIEALANKKNVITTGFIPQEKIALYFSAADILILPYKTFMSSSGPMAQAFSYELGVLLSDKLEPYFKTQDMKDSLTESDLFIEEILFKPEENFSNNINWALDNSSKLENFSKIMKEKRSWQSLGNDYCKIVKEVFNV